MENIENKVINKNEPLVQKIKDWVDMEYSSGRTTSISDEELVSIMEEFAPDLGKKI